jgi:ribose 5-phosphate isomerase B
MRVVLGSDHAGFEMKQNIIAHVQAMGHQIIDVGTDSSSPVDYPDFAEALGMAIINKEADRGILICGSGVGAVVAVNKIPGIRASVCHDCYSAHQGVEHDNMNVLVLGARIIAAGLAHDLVWMFLGAEFTSEERHLRRLDKLQKLESKFSK